MEIHMPSLTDEQLDLYMDYESEFSDEDRKIIQSLWTSLMNVNIDDNASKLQIIRTVYNNAIINNRYNLSLFLLYYYCIAKYRYSTQTPPSMHKKYDYLHRSGQYLDCPQHAFYAANEVETNYRITSKFLKFRTDKCNNVRTRTIWKIEPSDMFKHFCTMASYQFSIVDFRIRKSFEHTTNNMQYDCKIVLWSEKSKQEKITITSKVGIEFDFMMIDEDMVFDDSELSNNSNMFITEQFLNQLPIEKIKHTNYCYLDDKHVYRLSIDTVNKSNGKESTELNLEVEQATTDINIISNIIKNATIVV